MDRIGHRDLLIVQTLGRVRVANARQLQRAHFFSSTPLSNARSSRATLARLARWRVVARLDRRVGGVRSGSAGYVYSLDVVGRRLLEGMRPVGTGRFRRPWTPSATFLHHALAVTELYVRLLEAERGGHLEVLTYDAEPDCWRTFTGPGGEAVVVKPDAYVRIGVGAFEEHAFVEVDRGTESARALGIKLDRYRAYWASGREQQGNDVFPRVVWLVPDAKRHDQLVDVASRQPAEAWRLFKVARFEDAVSALAGGGNG
ncbi:MAG: replication-relaxation family protein [Actinomycetota bacterium]